MKRHIILIIIASISLLITACGGGSSSGTTDTPTVNEGENAAVTVTMEAEYGSDSVSDSRSMVPSVLTTCFDTTTDGAGYVPGIDCDSDGGVVAYLDPSNFKVAIKRLAFVMSDNTYVDLIPDTGILSDSVVVDLANPVTLDISEIPQGTYNSFYAELYYYEITMNIYGVEQQVRVYLSDDDFASEGSLGNHQGDIKLMDSSDTFKFVHAGSMWQDGLLDTVRPSVMGGASTADPETGHDRGLYGTDELWNTDPLFMQGADQDIFIANETLSMTGITVGSEGTSVTITFDMNDTWFFEDFNANGDFEPCIGLEACAGGAEWTPVFPGINFTFE